MNPVTFPESNCQFGPPAGTDESQVMTIPAYQGKMLGGPLDGSCIVVVAWQPSPEEVETLKQGGLLYLSCVGGLPPHFLSVGFPYKEVI